MTTVHDTAYPRIRSSITLHELAQVYTPTPQELTLAQQATRGSAARVGFLVLLKTFQRLGYFVPLAAIPPVIVQHIAATAEATVTPNELAGYDTSGTRSRHLTVIRETLQVQPYGRAARRVLVRAMGEAAATKDALADLINVAIEELIRQRFELPIFPTLVRTARRVRAMIYRRFYQQVFAALSADVRVQLDTLFVADLITRRTPWQAVKQDPGSPTLTHLKDLIAHLTWVSQRNVSAHALVGIPDVKVKHFAAEAHTLDATRMQHLEPHKRYTLSAALLHVQTARARDDLAEMLIKRMQAIHQKGKEALETYRQQHQQQTDGLVLTLRDLVAAYQSEGTAVQRFAAIDGVIGGRGDALLEQCEAHLTHAGNNYFAFLWRCYKSHRPTLFRLLKTLTWRSTSQDTALEDGMRFLLEHEGSKSTWLPTVHITITGKGRVERTPLVDLSWVPDGWWRLLTEQHTRTPYPPRVNRRHFEVCVFSQMLAELKSGDLAIEGSDLYADYRDQLISLEQCRRDAPAYGAMVGLPIDGPAFVTQLQAKLAAVAQATDRAFPLNQAVRIEAGEPVIRRPQAKAEPAGLRALEALLAAQLEPINLLDVLADTEYWINWTRFFGPISGHETKLDDPITRYLLATFCYGCQLGPTQLARSLGEIDRRQLAWVNLRHVTEEALEEANRVVVNAYHRFALPRRWGSGKHASADGTKWDVYEQNLLAEYHIRYGGYGGIGYYHVSDTYIALFSHFIPCGVWEAVYILDGLLKNHSDIQPDTIHADTQGQSEPVFGLASLLGISLMPRIRHWKHLKFYRPSRDARYAHIDELFSDTIDWDLIATHLPDMLQVVLSIKAGRITASTILRKLSTYSKKNRLYQAFRELGRVIRTMFLLEYMANPELRATIHAATNKSESFNNFVQWVGFGGDGTIASNDRAAQRKFVRYNHLVANCIIFYNVFAISHVLHDLQQKGMHIDDAAVAALSPYLTQHINRFGQYRIDPSRRPATLDYDLLTVAPADRLTSPFGAATG